MSNQIKVTDISPIAVGKKFTINLDVGWKYLKVHIKRTNFTASQALSYALKVNGKIRQELTNLKFLEDINTHYNRPQSNGVTTIYLSRPELADSEDRDLSGLGTADVQSVQIEFILDAGISGTPDIEVVADVVANENIGWITKYETSDINLAKVGKNVVSKMPVGDGNVFAYFLRKQTNDITDLTLSRVVNGAKTNVVESNKFFIEVDQRQAAGKPRVLLSSVQTVLDFTTSGVPEDALQTDFVQLPGDDALTTIERIGLDVTTATAEVITVITESVGEYRG